MDTQAQIDKLLAERHELITKRNADAEIYLDLIAKIKNNIDRKENTQTLLSMENATQLRKEHLREIDRQLRELGYTGELTSGC